MNTFLENRLHRPSAPLLRAAEAAWRGLARHFGRCAAAWQRHGDAAAAARALDRLDDRTLRDLGIHRSELLAIAHDPCDATRRRTVWL